MSDSQDQRLEKIEQKIDRLADAVVSIARIEERVATVLKQNDRFFIRMDKMEERVDAVENNGNINTRSFSFVERFLWVCVSSGVGLLVYFLR
tara:strand:+ start:248 stop:523 length:276 start_codon:yes stop_codon:yes gene_type:complete